MRNHIISKIFLWLSRKIITYTHICENRYFILRLSSILPSSINISTYFYIKSLTILSYSKIKSIIIKYIYCTFSTRNSALSLSPINPLHLSTGLSNKLV
nr:MAG TPA: hypothetical protein [Bacteriophage sp.]